MNLPSNMISSRYLKKPETFWLIIILCVSAALRFYHYGTFSYSNDELSALNRLHYNTFSELVQKGFYVDGHPGGIQVFLWQWVRLFGDSEWIVRLPFVIMGILSVWMSYKVVRLMFGTSAGLFTATAITFLQFPLLYSQIARPYGPGLLFCLMLVYYWLKIFFNEKGDLNANRPKMSHLAGFALSASLCMYTHYFSFLFALIVGFSGFVVARRKNIFHYIGAAIVATLLFVPHIPITLNHLTYKGVGLWLGVPDKIWIFNHMFFIFDQSVFILLVFLLTLLALLYLNTENKSNLRFRVLLTAWFLSPIIFGYIYSVKVSPVLQHPVLIFSFPYFIMLIFSYAANEFNRKKQWILAAFLSLGVLGTTVINQYYQKQHFGEFKEIGRLTAKWQQQFGDTAITKAISVNAPYYIDYYLKRNKAEVKFAIYDITGPEGLLALSELVRNSRTQYFLYALTKPAPVEGEDIIRSLYPYIVEMQNFEGFSSITLYGRTNGETYAQAYYLNEIKLIKANLNADTLISNGNANQEKAHKMDASTEYSPGIELSCDEFTGKDNLTIIAETNLYVSDNSGDAALVISIETRDGKSIHWKGAVSKYVELPGKWCHVINTLKVDSNFPKGAKLKVYFWNKDKKLLYLKNLECRIFE
jgi:4-amino-4-deoxy-L-arabinose transferase-like glycosyltransferase